MAAIDDGDIASIQFGLGRSRGAEIVGTANGLLAQLMSAEPVPARLAHQRSTPRVVAHHEILRRTGAGSDTAQAVAAAKEAQAEKARLHNSDRHARMTTAVESRAPFFERLVSFWSNHFTVSGLRGIVQGLAGPFEVEAIRPHVMGRFADMLVAASLHPAMVYYLDQQLSFGPRSRLGVKVGRGLNENLGREILELHSMGATGGYTQGDVTRLALLLTGWVVHPEEGRTVFQGSRAEPGPKTVLGVVYGADGPAAGDAKQALNDLARHPSTARHIAMKLVRHFLADAPPGEVVERLAEAYLDSGGFLPAVYEALVRSPEAWSGFGAKVKTPFEFVVSGLRAVAPDPALLDYPDRPGEPYAANPLSVGATMSLQQPLWQAPQPDGWSDRGENWINGLGLTARFNWIQTVMRRVPIPDPVGAARFALGSIAGPATRFAIDHASSGEEALFLALASPEFNRR